jgi:hypothetical protein
MSPGTAWPTPRSPPGRHRRQGHRRRSVRSPKALLDAVKAKRYGGLEDKRLGSVPVNFLSNLDITGGNSGSPVLDANGKLVGLAFDGNWESVSSNWVFDPVMTRMIAVDSRYMQWIMQEVAPAPQLLKELNLPKQRCGSRREAPEKPTGAGFILPARAPQVIPVPRASQDGTTGLLPGPLAHAHPACPPRRNAVERRRPLPGPDRHSAFADR